MQLLKFIETVDLAAKPEVERAMLLCFYHYKEDGETAFTMINISQWLLFQLYKILNSKLM